MDTKWTRRLLRDGLYMVIAPAHHYHLPVARATRSMCANMLSDTPEQIAATTVMKLPCGRMIRNILV